MRAHIAMALLATFAFTATASAQQALADGTAAPAVVVKRDTVRMRVGATATITVDVVGIQGEADRAALRWSARTPRVATIVQSAGSAATVRGESAGTATVDVRHTRTGAVAAVVVEVTDDAMRIVRIGGLSRAQFTEDPLSDDASPPRLSDSAD